MENITLSVEDTKRNSSWGKRGEEIDPKGMPMMLLGNKDKHMLVGGMVLVPGEKTQARGFHPWHAP